MSSVPSLFSEKRKKLITWTLLPLGALNGMVIDLVAPSLPSIASGLHVSSAAAKNVITLYLLGYALGNFCSGFLTDALGRKYLFRTGLLGFVLVSLLPVIFPNIAVLLSARLFQGIAIGTIAVVSRAIFSDILPPEKLVRMGTLFGSMYGIGSIIGPLIGGYLQFYSGWKACFLFFAIVTFIPLIAVLLILPETHFQRHSLKLKIIAQHFSKVLHHKQFMALVLIMGMAYSLIIAFNTLGPFLIQTKMHHTPIFFGNTALWLGAAFLGATFFCRFCLKKYQVEQLLFFGVHAFFVVALLSLMTSFVFQQSLLLLLATSMVMFFATGFTFPMCMGKGMMLFQHIAGTASATMFFINVLMTSATAFLLSFINVQNSSTLIAIDGGLLGVCVLVYWKFLRD